MSLKGKSVVITSGPTREHLDPVRFMTNASSGRMGAALASAALRAGARVTVVAGPGAPVPAGARALPVVTALDMRRRTLDASRRADVVIAAAAVGDWRFASPSSRKVKRAAGALTVRLLPNPDIVADVARRRRGGRPFVVGFALETHDWLAHAAAKLRRKRLDLVVANEASALGGASTRLALVDADGALVLAPMSKARAAGAVIRRVSEALDARR